MFPSNKTDILLHACNLRAIKKGRHPGGKGDGQLIKKGCVSFEHGYHTMHLSKMQVRSDRILQFLPELR